MSNNLHNSLPSFWRDFCNRISSKLFSPPKKKIAHTFRFTKNPISQFREDFTKILLNFFLVLYEQHGNDDHDDNNDEQIDIQTEITAKNKN